MSQEFRIGPFWDDLEPGMTFETPGRTVTETDIINFVNVTGMTEGLFLDIQEISNSPYGKRIAPAALVFSFAEGLVIQAGLIHKTGIAFLGMDLTVAGPTYVGNTIRVHVAVTEKRPTRNPGRGIVITHNEVVDETGRTVLRYDPVRLVKRRS